MSRTNPDYLISTDLDSDYDQGEVINAFALYILEGRTGAVGAGYRKFEREDNPYEWEWLQLFNKIFKEKSGVEGLDPFSMGTMLIRGDVLNWLLENPTIQNYDMPWGIPVLIPLLEMKEHGKEKVPIVYLPGKYDPSRRPAEKVRRQADSYLNIISLVKGINIEELYREYRQDIDNIEGVALSI